MFVIKSTNSVISSAFNVLLIFSAAFAVQLLI